MKHISSLASLACALMFTTSVQITSAASHTWSGVVNGLFSNPLNWSAGGVPTLAETNTLVFPGGATRTTVTNDIGGLKVSLFNFTGSNYIVRGTSTFTNGYNIITMVVSGGSNTIESAVYFSSAGSLSVGNTSTLVLSGALSGTNGLIKTGSGKLYLRGGASNPLSGDLTLYSGELHFQKTGGVTPYNGNSIIIGSTDVGDPTQLFFYANDTIPDGATVSLQPSGALVMNGFSDNVNTVNMYAGLIQTGAGVLGIYNSLNLSPRFVGGITFESPTITGSIGFQNGPCTISVTSNTCNIAANIVNIVSATTINKTGAGTLGLNGSGSSFTGALNINQGRVVAGTSSALGTIAGATAVTNGATLEISTGVNTSEPLNLSGLGNDGQGALQGYTGTCSGTITVTNETGIGVQNVSDTLTLSGPISGNGSLRKFGDGNLSFTGFGNNTFSGASFVTKGALTLGKGAGVRAVGSVTVTNGAQLVWGANEQIDDAAALTVYVGGSANLNNRNESIAGLNIGGTMDTGTGTLTLLGNVFVGKPYTTNSAPPAVVRGNMSLGGAMRSVTSTNQDSIMFDCAISDGPGVGGLNLTNGTFGLLRSNSFTGPVWLTGTCIASNAFAFGAPGGNIFATNAIITLALSNMVVSGESLTAAGSASVGFLGVGSNVWNGNISIVDSNTTFYFSGFNRPQSKSLTINGVISGNCDLFYVDNGKLILTASNSFSGPILMNGWWFANPGGQVVARHPNALGVAGQPITINDGGTLRLELPSGAAISGKPLTFTGAADDFVAPFLVHAGAVSNNWNGPISMTALPSRISVLDYSGVLKLNTVITGGGSLAKTGFGTLILAGNGTNQLSQLIGEHGMLRLAQTGGYALPTGNVTVLGDELLVVDDMLWSSPAIIGLDQPGQLPPNTSLLVEGPEGRFLLNNQNLTIRSLAGAGYLYTGTGTLTLSNAPGENSFFFGRISSEFFDSARTNLIKQGTGSLNLHGPAIANYDFNGGYWSFFEPLGLYGKVQMQGGFLSLSNGIIGSLELASDTSTTVRSAPLEGPGPEYRNGLRLGSLSGSGNISLINGTWVYLGTDDSTSVFDGAMDGDLSTKLIKTGTGASTLNGSGVAFVGSTLVEQGTLLVNTQFNCNVTVQRKDPGMTATLGGIGQVQNVTVTGLGSAIAPGATTNTPSFGRLKVNGLTLGAGSLYRCEINSTNAGVDMDQIDAASTVSLNGGGADFIASGLGATSNRYAVVKSPTPVLGTFNGRPEGSLFYPGVGRGMLITYLLAGGKEVTLIEYQASLFGNFGFTGVTRLTNGHISLVGTGAPSAAYYVLANTNLSTTNWVPIGNVNGHPFDGAISFTDTNAPNFLQRFYCFQLQ